MDLEHFIGNRELLERLSREYELLQASGAEVDYAAWVRQRLREAAADVAAASVGAKAQGAEAGGTSSQPQADGESGAEADCTQGQGQVAEDANKHPEQLSLSRNPGAPATGQLPRPFTDSPGGVRPETAWFLHGEGTTGPTSQTLTAAIFGPTTTAATQAVAATEKPTKATKKNKRVIIISPQRSPARQPHTSQPAAQRQQQQQPFPPVSKLYTRTEPGLFSSRPDAYVHPEARPRSLPQAARRPDWVNAASLQAALRGASSAIPHLQAAAERERRMALSTALARQTLAAGMSPDEARAVALYGTVPTPAATAAAATQAAQYDHVLLVAQQLAQQNEQLARAVQENSAQLAQQQVLLESALMHQPGTENPTSEPAASGTSAANPAVEPPRIEVEPGPPAWFARRAPGSAAASRGASKSPQRRSRTRSPPLVRPAAATATTTASTTTTKERDRATRKEALKALLKQVLGGAGLAGGEEGRRRLASGMAEAEKLVAAIQTLAVARKTAKSGKGKPQVEASEELAMAAGKEAAVAALASVVAGGVHPRALSRTTSTSGVMASRPTSRAASRQGSGRSRPAEPEAQQLPSTQAPPAADPSPVPQAAISPAAVPPQPTPQPGPTPAVPAAACAPCSYPAPAVHAVSAAAGGGGSVFLMESLEDQVQQIVERDAAAYAEAARLQKIDALEQRLTCMVDKVESRLARALQPLQLNAQQQQPPQQPGQEGGGSAALAPAHGGGGGAEPAAQVLSPRSAGLSVLELQRMLIQINRMESQEQEVRRKWFQDPAKGPRQRVTSAQPIVVHDGLLGSLDPPPAAAAADAALTSAFAAASTSSRSPSPPPPEAPHLPCRSRLALPTSNATRAGAGASNPWSFAHEPTERTLALHNAAAAGTGAPPSTSLQAADGTAASAMAAGAGCDPISDATLESVLRGRRRFLRAQQLADGDLLVAAEPRSLNPVQVMEDLTDVLLEEMLREQAEDLLGLCDSLGEHMVKEEFQVQEP
ncbi:hypothetical protein Agub_g1399 [Astrephomene gubernaculifera]|uniref:Uncharacterized protein n=1 Tax=Astrephomene gubernaculifera TaxID=47775 RepID=A0AAD3DFC0_9CHLO|nr:hypothetical protein Agub_g1399 [Astrephomene gubernaculifera]